MAQLGRKEIKISKRQFEQMMKIHCTQEETAAVLGVAVNTLKSWCKREYGKTFSEVADSLRAEGRVSLRRLGYKHAQKNCAVWIFLAKNELGMSDAPTEQQNDINVRVENVRAMSKAIDNAAKYMKKNNIDDASLADIPDAADYEEDIE